MEYDTVLKIIKKRRTVRKYIPDKQVPMETVEAILEASRWAPSGANSQPWEFIIVRENEKVKKVAKVFIDQAERILATGFPHPPQSFHKKVSTYILVCSDDRFKSIYPGALDGEFIYNTSLGACIQTILLAATSLGVASAWQTPTTEPQAHQELKEIFKLPEYVSIHSIVILGYTKGDKMAADFRRPLESMIHIDRFDETKLRNKELTQKEKYFPELLKNVAERQKERKNLQKEN